MPTLMRIHPNKIEITGTLSLGGSQIRLHQNGNLEANEVYNSLSAFNTEGSVDDSRTLDDTFGIDDNDSIEKFLTYLFGLEEQSILPNKVMFYGNKIVANSINQNIEMDGV